MRKGKRLRDLQGGLVEVGGILIQSHPSGTVSARPGSTQQLLALVFESSILALGEEGKDQISNQRQTNNSQQLPELTTCQVYVTTESRS